MEARIRLVVRVARVEHRQVELLADGPCDLVVADHPALDQHLIETFAGLPMLHQRHFELFARDQALVEQDGGDSHGIPIVSTHPAGSAR